VFFDGFLTEEFGTVGLVVDAAFEAAETWSEEDHAGGVEEHS